jgi:HAD superfamily hydrolase (TIGR01509 family)
MAQRLSRISMTTGLHEMNAIQLVIFDCDGVLVDSEYLACRIEAKLLTDAGFPIDHETMAERFSGMNFRETLLEIEREAEVPLSASLIEQSDRLIDLALETQLEAVDGVTQTLSKIRRAKCICSNSSSDRLGIALSRTGLYRHFEQNIFSAYEVGTKRGKPDPNVYQFAAKRMNALPGRTVVIEDSVPGVTAAFAAGMRVIGFTGGKHSFAGHGDRLIDAGAETVVSRFTEIPAMVDAFEVWAGPDAA